ncbi:MAG: hypothetical protein C4291_00755 [Candidatus Dadabacteria bacterium]
MKLNRSGLILLLILLLGLFLRTHNLSKESIWFDEGYSISVADLSLLQIVVETYKSDQNLPLYYIILHFWISLFGDSEFSVRFPSVIFGLFAIFMLYEVGRLIFDNEVGILGSLLLGLSLFHIRYSQEARCYSLMVLLTLISIYFFIRLFKERSLIFSIGYILSSTLLIYTHVYGLFIIIAQDIYIVTLFLSSKENHKLNFRLWILLQFILITLFIPEIGFFLRNVSDMVHHGYWIPVPVISSIIDSFFEYAGSRYLSLLFLILSSFSIVNCEKFSGSFSWRDFFKSIESYRWNIYLSDTNRVYLVLVWLLTPIVLPFLISRFLTPIYITRYTIGASLAFYLLLSKGIRNLNFRYIKLAAIGIITILSLRAVWMYYTNTNKEQWREVANYIDTNAERGDLLVFNCYPCAKGGLFDYYSKRIDLTKKVFSRTPSPQPGDYDIREISISVRGCNRVWYIMASEGYQEDKEFIKKTLSEAYNLSYYKRYVGIEVYLFSNKSRKK